MNAHAAITESHTPCNNSLSHRVGVANAMLRNCDMCELHCGVDRTAGELGDCHLGADTYAYKSYLSLNEELELIPAFRVFLAGCNFRCVFCDEGPTCFRADVGQRVEVDDLASALCGVLASGAKTISLLGGEPSLHAHTILALAAAAPHPLPLALNTNMYMTPQVLDLLDGVVTVYLADFKFGNDHCAQQLAGVPRYMEVVSRNLIRAAASTDVIVRHLLLPGHLDCCFYPIVDWLAENLSGIRFQLYPGYVPCGGAIKDHGIGRLNTSAEAQSAADYLQKLNLLCDADTITQGRKQCAPDQTVPTEVAITIGVDGRLYCHDMAADLLPILNTLCPADQELKARTMVACPCRRGQP